MSHTGHTGTRIAVCVGCKPHPYQDRRYGKGKRVHNASGISGRGKGRPSWRCTVCGRETEVGS